jgi:hypothetical protein
MSETATANPPAWALWRRLLTWSPFQIDALGLITLLGADEVNSSVGRLVRSKFLEYLPLLGAYVIANESFREKKPGFHIYNISQGIHTTDLAPWFSRWIQAQNFEQTRSFVRWTYERQENRHWEQICGISFSVGLIGFLLAMTVLSYDWYGFANVLSLFGSVLVRTYMVRHLREAIDKQVLNCVPEDVQDDRTKRGRDTHALDHGWLGTPRKVLIITADAKAVTMLVPSEFMAPPSPFIARLPAKSLFWYSVMRWVGWIAFAVQVVSLGMADLATQLVTVVLMVTSTVLFVSKLGCDDSHWGIHIAHTWERIKRKLNRESKESARSIQPSSHDEEKVLDRLQPTDSFFEFKYSCWIGKYLKAEIYEWPPNHNYTVDKSIADAGTDRVMPYNGEEHRSEKRQHLYAWLQLTKDEVDSMDKWDLFPHKRKGDDNGWLEDYTFGSLHIEMLQSEKRGGQGIKRIVDRAAKTEVPVTQAETMVHFEPQQQQQQLHRVQTFTNTPAAANSASQSPTSPTVTSPEGVVSSSDVDGEKAVTTTTAVATSDSSRPDSSGGAVVTFSAAADDDEADDIDLRRTFARQGTGKLSINSANYVSGEAAQVASRARRRSHGELALPPKMANRDGREKMLEEKKGKVKGA